MLFVKHNFEDWLRKVPFLRLLLPFILGILCFEHTTLFHFSSTTNIICCATAVLLVSIGLLISKKNNSTIWLFGFYAQTAMFVFGGVLAASYTSNWQQLPSNNQPILVVAQVLDEPIGKPKSHKTILLVTQYKRAKDSVWHRTNVKLLTYFSKKSSKTPQIGQQIVAAIKPQKIEQFNGATFDYPQYLARQYIYQQAFIAPQKWRVLNDYAGWNVYIEAQRAQKKLLGVFQQLGFGGEELAVIAALTVGYKNLIDNDTCQAFAISGAMHILAVSGLHVGIIFWILNTVLFFMKWSQTLKILKAIVILIAIWLYSFLAGMAPSIERAAIMFSIITLAQITSRPHNMFNVLASSAFIIILINPYSVFDIGFQLSYLAIVGIVYFYPFIYKQISIGNRIVDYVFLQTIASSIAALLVTLPLTMYYFGTIPTWSLITNIIGIPLSFLITVVIVLALAMFPVFPWAAQWLGFAAERSTWLFNKCIHTISELPYAQLHYKASGWLLACIYFALLGAIICIEEYKYRHNYKKISD